MTTNHNDPFKLSRFVEAQSGDYDRALAEIRNGRKRSHWMWYVFPQVAGLGFSGMSRRYAISSREEARAYLGHPLLGPRLEACFEAVLGVQGRTAHAIFGSPDDLKLRSSATLFAAVSEPGSVFQQVIDRYFDGEADGRTLELLAPMEPRTQ
jgi:uncharacterized protein (DUF1810 family)